MSGFDRVVTVDGSASSRPKRGRDSIWIGHAEADRSEPPLNPATRAGALDALTERCGRPGRTLLAVDWSLGYPTGTAAHFGLVDRSGAGAAPWRAMHDHLAAVVVDGADNHNNRFEIAGELNARVTGDGPFWGAPRSRVTGHLAATKPASTRLGEWRFAEQRLRALGLRPASCWQLTGAGSVGSQSLLGIALLSRLRRRLAPRRLAIWPFDTGLASPAGDVDVVVAEMWPTLLLAGVRLPEDVVRDAAQVDLTACRLFDADRSGELVDWWAPTVADRSAVIGEEGWVIGLT